MLRSFWDEGARQSGCACQIETLRTGGDYCVNMTILVVGAAILLGGLLAFWSFRRPVTTARGDAAQKHDSDQGLVAEPTRHAFIEVTNSYGHFDSSPLLVLPSPNLDEIMGGDTPVVQKLSAANRTYWASADLGDRRMTALIGYLQHPDPSVRVGTMRFVPSNGSSRVAQALVDVLMADPDSTVRSAAASTIWECEKAVHCKYAVGKLEDEVHRERDRNSRRYGSTRAQSALRLLLAQAPDEPAKQGLSTLLKGRSL